MAFPPPIISRRTFLAGLLAAPALLAAGQAFPIKTWSTLLVCAVKRVPTELSSR